MTGRSLASIEGEAVYRRLLEKRHDHFIRRGRAPSRVIMTRKNWREIRTFMEEVNNLRYDFAYADDRIDGMQVVLVGAE